MKQIAILGSTGSIGQSTLSIIEKYPDRFAVASLAAGKNFDAAFEQCIRWRPAVVSLATAELADAIELRLRQAGITGMKWFTARPERFAWPRWPRPTLWFQQSWASQGWRRRMPRLRRESR